MGKGLHKLFKTNINEISIALPIMYEFRIKISYFIPVTINFTEANRILKDIKKLWLKLTME